ncbi:uncharacterized protein LOC114022415 isoform X5 [Chelonia mydas]|uniref:uncharacterized protein LOC114022415 isoform X5 n=1 Tax=Chelonia mydas TaxID=8469 RepID=UPI0018A1FEFD|nr:uncharacterized protein LOC114022415 isoform X5 [Chelonia mydas]
MGPVLAVWGRLSSKLGAPVALGGRAGRCLQPPTSDTKAREGAKLCPEGPVARTEPIPHRGPQGAPLGDRCTETLFITLPEMDLWEQLSGVLATSLWQVMAREHCQGDAGILALSSPQEAVLAAKVMRQMVRCCLCSVYGTFLESMSFPLLGAGQTLPAMLEEISCYLEHQPNTWMKLVQIVRPLGLLAPRLVAEDPSTRAEALPFCWPEYPLFLRYVDESAAVRREFKGRLEEAGYGFRACPHWGILTFPAVASPAELHGWEAVFCSVHQHYVVHCEGWEDLLEALAAEPSLVKAFGSIRVYDGEDFVGLVGEMAPFLQRLTVRAFQRQLVSQEYLAEPLPRWVIIKDMVEKELPDPHVRMELRQGTPAIITFQGPRRQVAEAESRCQQLLRAFQVLSVPVSPLQARFIQEHREDVFTPSFFLDWGIATI